MSPIEPVEIVLDKPRKLLINHFALYRAEAEVNKLRFAKPADYTNITALLIDTLSGAYKSFGMLPMDLLLTLICFGLVYDDPKEKRLTLEQVAGLLDLPDVNPFEISKILIEQWLKTAGNTVKVVNAEDATGDESEKKTADQQTGSSSGPSVTTTLN